MYYLEDSQKRLCWFGKILAVLFAIFCIGGSFGGGNMFQSNQAAQIFNDIIGNESSSAGFYFGLVMAAFVGVVIRRVKRIASVTEKIVPFMVGIYLLAAFVVIGMNISQVGSAFVSIFDGAFSPSGVTGGIIGVLIQGFRRAAFSNEAGGFRCYCSYAVKTKFAASEGIVALLEPFIDT